MYKELDLLVGRPLSLREVVGSNPGQTNKMIVSQRGLIDKESSILR